MRKITIVCVGNLKEKYWVDAISEYQKRMQRFFDFKIVEIAESKLQNKPTKANIEKALLEEEQKMLPFLTNKIVVPMCIEGKQLDSVELSKLIEKQTNEKEMCFVIGSSFGLSKNIKDLGTPLSFGKITLPHQLIRVVLCEQVYRAGTILNNVEYHK